MLLLPLPLTVFEPMKTTSIWALALPAIFYYAHHSSRLDALAAGRAHLHIFRTMKIKLNVSWLIMSPHYRDEDDSMATICRNWAINGASLNVCIEYNAR